MRKILLLLLIAGTSLTMQAQQPIPTLHRMDAMAQRQVMIDDGKLKAVSMTTDDAEALAASIRKAGYHATAVSDKMVTATVPAHYLRETLDADHRISRIYGYRPFHFFMDKAREDVGVKTIRQSSEFETPFTGKGVLVAMIDGGFKYDHIAFLDSEGNKRVKVVWNRKDYASGETTEPTTDIPAGNDNYPAPAGHGTHTTGIAAGSVISQNDYSGIAPEADIIMISSSMEPAEVMEDLTYINQYAQEKGQPYVVNMSFGEITGPHDGLTPYDQFINDIATGGNGRALVMAAGNSGTQKVHVGYTFTQDDEQVAIAIKQSGDAPVIDLWGKATDGQRHLTVKAYKCTSGGTPTELTFEGDMAISEVCSYNGKEHYFHLSSSAAHSIFYTVFVVSGKAGDGFEAWTEEGHDFQKVFFTKLGLTSLEGDNAMSIGGSGQCAEKAFCVGNYTTKTSINSIVYGEMDLQSMGMVNGLNELDPSSSIGPTTRPELRKPDVAAPGGVIVSAIDYVTESSDEGPLLVEKINVNGEDQYYMASSGTSMAAPMVSGTMALWLQANPNLSCDQLHEIVESTARHDAFTGDEEWNQKWGYGKIDAYEGLKMALQMADATGIPAVYGSDQPVSLKKQSGQWQVLFNSDEPRATITIYDQQGRIYRQQSLNRIQRGQEQTLSLNGLTPGVYVVSIATAKSKLTRKLVVD